MAKKRTAPIGFTDEERRLRVRLAEMGKRQKDIAAATGICKTDISHVISGTCDSPRYVAEVYRFLGLDMPSAITAAKENTAVGGLEEKI